MSSSHSYASSYPSSVPVDGGIKTFFEEFYRISDSPTEHEAYAECFASDATFVIGVKQVQGRDAVLTMRKGMWDAVASRKHTIYKVFPFGEKSDELMLYGRVQYGLKNGKGVSVDWAARAEMTNKEEGGEWKFRFYQVYLDSAAMAQAK